MRRAALLFVIAVGSAATAAEASAQAPFEVVARTALVVSLDTSSETRVGRVGGKLRDDLGQPLPGREITITYFHRGTGAGSPRSVVTTTLADGSFTAPTPEAARSVRVEFEGDDHHDGSFATIDPASTRSSPQLQLLLRARVFDLTLSSHRVTIVARSASGRPLALPVALFDERGRKLAEGRTDDLGRLTISLRSESLGAPGVGSLLARSVADDRLDAAQIEAAIVRQSPTLLTLSSAPGTGQPTTGQPARSQRLQGRLSARGTGLSDAAVGIFLGERHLGTALTDQAGRFDLETIAMEDADGTFVARFESTDAAYASSESAPVSALALSPAPATEPWPEALVGLAAPVLIAALWWLRRRREGDGAIGTRTARRSPRLPWHARPPEPSAPSHRARAQEAFHEATRGWLPDEGAWATMTNAEVAAAAPAALRAEARAIAEALDALCYDEHEADLVAAEDIIARAHALVRAPTSRALT